MLENSASSHQPWTCRFLDWLFPGGAENVVKFTDWAGLTRPLEAILRWMVRIMEQEDH